MKKHENMNIIHFPHRPTKIISKQIVILITVYRSLCRHSWWSRKECLTWRSYPSICLSVHNQVSATKPSVGFSWNLVCQFFIESY